jgi:hypothetical protein
VVNRALSPRQTDMVVSWDQEEFIMLPFSRIGTHDPWGVVTSIIHEYRSFLQTKSEQGNNRA